jgi:hypothetical protein
MIGKIFKVLFSMFKHIFRRGRGIFKFLFVIDDFFRLFTMTILIPVLFNFLNFGSLLVSLGAALGIIIDVHDFLEQAGVVSVDMETVMRKR